MSGKLYLVSVGPGFADLIAPMAQKALEASDAIVGYDLYLRWIQPWIEGKQIITMPLTRERDRALKVIELAREGKVASLVSSGDIGVYAMATLVLEEMSEDDRFEVKIIPGVSAANSCASILGSPLSHDFATLSLSDLLCPWEWIEHRARHLAEADMVTALYNVQSLSRQEGVYRILRIMLEHKSPETVCGVVRSAYREDQSHYICTLGELVQREFDMMTTIIVGNRFTKRKQHFMFTPRGYNSWKETDASLPSAGKDSSSDVWVFSGTSDGNALAAQLADAGTKVIVSTASDYGREMVVQNFPNLAVRSGRMGVEARRLELKKTGAKVIVDATHPFASEISKQLIELASELGITYLRYERPVTQNVQGAILCRDIEEAVEKAMAHGTRIFLATGSKDLATFLKQPKAAERQWFARIAPDTESLQKALGLGIPRGQLCVMQGPFTQEFNQMLWKNWQIDCVVTKDSGEAGGFEAKEQAARSLGIPLIVVQRPVVAYPAVAHDFQTIIQQLAPSCK